MLERMLYQEDTCCGAQWTSAWMSGVERGTWRRTRVRRWPTSPPRVRRCCPPCPARAWPTHVARALRVLDTEALCVRLIEGLLVAYLSGAPVVVMPSWCASGP